MTSTNFCVFQMLSFPVISDRNLQFSNLGMVLELDGEGKIIGSLQGHTGQQVQVSEAGRVGDYIFFGSPFNRYLGKLYVGEPPSMEVEGKGVRMKTEDEASPKPGKDKEKQQQPADAADRQEKKDEL